jgi:hypothetical protein
MIDKRVKSIAEAMRGIKDGSIVLFGGFGAVGHPTHLIDGLIEQGAKDLTLVGNNAGSGRVEPPRPVGAQHPVALELAGDPATEIEYLLGGLALERIADGVLAERSDALGEHAVAALGLEAVQRAKLTGRPQQHRIEDLGPGMRGVLAAFGHGRHGRRPVENLVEIGFKLVAAQGSGALLAAQQAAQVELSDLGGGLLEALAEFDFGAHFVGQFGGNVEDFRFSIGQDREQELAMKLDAVGAAAGGLAAGAGAHDEGAGEHLAEGAEAADESAAQVEFGIGGHI